MFKFFVIIMLLILCLGQCSCTIIETARDHHKAEQGPVWVEYEDRGVWIKYKTTRPRPKPRCGPLYDVGRHTEWAACMGVGYVAEEER